MCNILLLVYDSAIGTTQFVYECNVIGLDVSFGVDGISLCLIYLTSFFIPLCILFTWNNEYRNSEYILCILCIEILLLLVFTVQNLI